MSCLQIPLLSERDQRALDRVLQGLDRTQARADSVYGRVRRHDRLNYRATISITLPPPQGQDFPGNLDSLPIGWAYSLSQGGVGFVSLQQIEAEMLSIALHLPNDRVKWMTGRVVRCREIPMERFFDYGISFGVSGSGSPAADA